MQDRYHRKINLGFGLVAIAFGSLIVTAIYLNQARARLAVSAAHTQQALSQIRQIRIALLESESEARDYLLTGSNDSWESFVVSHAEAARAGNQVRRLSVGDAAVTQQLNSFEAELAARKAKFNSMIQTYRNGRYSAMAALLDAPATRQVLAAPMASIAGLEDQEQQIVLRSSRKWTSYAAHMGQFSFVMSLSVIVLVYLLYITVRRDAVIVRETVQLRQEAETDGLTGLFNHRALDRQLGIEFQRSARSRDPLSMLMIDVDRFKLHNDDFGHPAGDRALKQVADILASNARGYDFVARYGGEEFAVLLPGTDRDGAIDAAERIRAAVARFSWPERALTVSVGVASVNAEIESPATMLQKVDTALYYSKSAGRDLVTHADALEKCAA